MSEKMLELLFPGHPYGHSTIGYEEDVADMPNHFQSARRFYEEHYRPNNCVLIVAGDVRAADVFTHAEKRYGAWKARELPPVKAVVAAQKGELRAHVAWDADVAPAVWVAYRMPAFKPATAQAAAAQVLGELLVSPAAPLYKKIRYEKQAASSLGFEEGTQGFESFDPRALIIGAELFKDKFGRKGSAYFDETASDIIAGVEALKNFSKQPGAEKLLDVVKSKYRYDFLAALSSPEKIAAAFAWYYRFDRNIGVLDSLLQAVSDLRPDDVDALARQWFVADNRVIVTMAFDPKK
jgi:zinc protease